MDERSIQDLFLTELERNHIPSTLFLMNGFQMRGIVRAHDMFAVLLDSDGRQNLIYKHAISTIQPSQTVAASI